MASLASVIDEVASSRGFSGVVTVDRDGDTEVCAAYGFADRAQEIPNRVDTLFATASGTKGLTALTIMCLVEQGSLELTTPARSILGADLPLIDDAVTVEHLLAHRSGIGDYLDEDTVGDITDYVMPVPVHQLASTASYLPLLDGHPMVSPPGALFRYNNSGYVLLALLAERVSGADFPQLVRTLVCEPAGMTDTAFLRSDELPARAARNYLWVDGLRTNVLHLPVLGSGDGGIFSTAADFSAFWSALLDGRIVSTDALAEMTRPRSDWPEEHKRYGLGFHLAETGDDVWLEGYDAGVSFLSRHKPGASTTYTVMSNWSNGAWPIAKAIEHASSA